ncbi:hypothetical protein K490DRAFT_56126 [Saccharata proteae CBS 121410]|uniref:Restriction of telomere capping protein 4 n=1 Tax=Saccharata proteae CBS 121410 TaxID=1314787 RepID=A0A9P4M0P7_9PEZI|nr:hypothetical protein K490DRAFT_56126 [Saccharata proteae CBS 121410]
MTGSGNASRFSRPGKLKRPSHPPSKPAVPPAPNDDINADPISSSEPEPGSASDGNKSSEEMTYKPTRTYGARAPRAPGRRGGRNISNTAPATGRISGTQGSTTSSTRDVEDDFDPVWDGKTFNRPTYLSTSTPQETLKKQFKAPSMIGRPSKPAQAKFRNPNRTYSGNTRQNVQQIRSESQPTPVASPPASKFQAPADHVLESMRSRANNAGSQSPPQSSDLSPPPSSPDLELMSEHIDADGWTLPKPSSTYEDPGRCPMCKAPVDPSLIKSWTGLRTRMNVRTQMRFCTHHKRLEAEEEYRARDYPAINWETLPSRFPSYRSHLVDILTQTRPSYFRKQLADRAARGANRARRSKLVGGVDEQELKASSPGYYGSRGRQVMEGWIMREMMDEIRARAGEDRLIGTKGVSGYIQVVLVPELATLLVMEDMEAEEGRAREVLEESVEYGDLLHKAIEDRIERPEDEEEAEEEVEEDEDEDEDEKGDDDDDDDGDGDGGNHSSDRGPEWKF